jgi:hypothetical protein
MMYFGNILFIKSKCIGIEQWYAKHGILKQTTRPNLFAA